MNYLDYIIIAGLIFYGLWGLAKGLTKLVFDFLGYVVAFLAAKYLSPFAIDYLQGTGVAVSIQESLYKTFSRISPTLTHSVETIKIPDNLTELISSEPGLRSVFNTYPTLRESIDQNIASLSGEPFMATLATYIIGIISIVIIFVVVKILFSVVVSIILSRNDQLPLAITNRILGMVVGVAVAIGLIALSLQLLETYSLTSSPVIAETIAHSKYGYLFTSLPLLEWLQNIMPK